VAATPPSLDRTHPGAAASLREGLDETLTLQRLGIRGTLYRTLATTNPIENLNGAVSRITRNVKRWRDGATVRWWFGG
jgi:putative transposase